MCRRLWALFLLMLLLTGCGSVQPNLPNLPNLPNKPRVAILLSDDVRMPKVEGLKEGLAALGYGEESLTFTVYSAGGDRERLVQLAEEALQSRPAILVAGGAAEAAAFQQTGNTAIPVVLMGAASTVRSGLVDSLARPGGLITGLDNQHAELSAKRLELLTKLLPGARRILVLYDPLVVPGQHGLEVTRAAAERLGVSLAPMAVESAEKAREELGLLEPGQFDAALLLPAFVLESGARPIAAELERLGLPVMGPLDLEGEAGLLAAYGVSMRAQGQQSARFVAKLLQGEKPAAIPVETPDNPELVVDLRVARRLGISLGAEGMAFAHTREEVQP